MTQSGRVFGTLPASDLGRAKDFYAQNLGLKPARETEDGLVYECADNTKILLFTSYGRASGDHTQATFEVADVDKEVAHMKANGVVFIDYDLPGFKTENGIKVDEGRKSAWFKDSEGNLLSITDNMSM